MTLYEFISELKHKSLGLDIFTEARIEYLGTLGELLHAIVLGKIGHREIDKIEPLSKSLNIFLRKEN